jgi:non-lysosomal glucosylceramidase
MDSNQGCCKGSCGCNAGMDRRTFLKLSAAAGAAAMLGSRPAVAGPFTRADFDKLVPTDKKLSPDWIRSLTERGSRTVYRGAELEKIGMPIGGICAGQLYLGGDGTLWHWDIFNRHVGTGAEHYAKPMKPASPISQGFAISIGQGDKRQIRTLDAKGFGEVSFIGEYPVGFVEYRDPALPVAVSLEAFSPFIPHNVKDSSLPATVMRFTIKNTGTEMVEGAIAGWLENGVCLYSGKERDGVRRNRILQKDAFVMLECGAEGPIEPEGVLPREDIVFDDFEKPTYEGWTAEGTAFGTGPIETKSIPGYQGDVGGHGDRVVNSHATAPGDSVEKKDSAVGTLTSRPFTIERDYIRFRIGGGSHAGKTCMNLQIDGQTVRSATGANDNRMKPQGWSVRQWKGKTAHLVIVDAETGGWGNVGIDEIVFSDKPTAESGPLQEEPDFGTMGLALLDPQKTDAALCELPQDKTLNAIFAANGSKELTPAVKPLTDKLSGSLARAFALAPGESAVAAFAIAWYFPNLAIDRNNKLAGRFYAQSFASAVEVVGYLAANFKSLRDQTLLWRDTWYDSTLPYWFLDRSFLNTSILATSTCFRFADGRFYGWEGVGCCPGTCGHVWQYAHAVARLFPELERDTRQRVDFGLAMKPDGAIYFRGEFNDFPAIDAQAGVILRALREHQMTTSNDWLAANWPKIRRATEWLIAKDANDDGIIESNQHNTLDTDWFGPVAWLSGLYLAALRAAEAMATIAGDADFAARCGSIIQRGPKNLVEQLFDGEYFINKPDPAKPETINSGTGCEIDQVMGQSWAFQVGLPRVLPEKESRSALASLWKYNFTPDVGPYRKAYPPGRWYAMPGEGGLLMCSFPRSDWDYDKAKGKGPDWAAGYFNECMNGFEYQAAGHMIWEGMVQEGLAVTRMLHDRYHASRRNPFNEVECGDHYARSMASYGVYLAACGYRYDGPAGMLAFDPRLTPDNFRAAFTTAQGWGSYSQKRQGNKQSLTLNIRWGSLRLRSFACGLADNARISQVKGRITSAITDQSMEHSLKPSFKIGGKELAMIFEKEIILQAGQTLDIQIG